MLHRETGSFGLADWDIIVSFVYRLACEFGGTLLGMVQLRQKQLVQTIRLE